MSSHSGGVTAAVAADPDDLFRFVEQGQRYVAAVAAGHERVVVRRRAVVATVGAAAPVDHVGRSVERLLAAAVELNDHVRSVAVALRERSARGCGPLLRRAILDGRLPPPTDEVRDRVLAAITDGLDPADADLDPALLPAAYRRHRSLTARIAELEARRDDADGHPLAWWDGDDATIARLDAELDELRSERDALAEHGIEADGSIDPLDAVALVAETTGGSAWEGRAYADAFAAHHRDRLADGGLFGRGAGAIEAVDGFADEFDHLAERVAAEREVALAFYDRLGPDRSADLPTFVIGAEGPDDPDAAVTLDRLARGLARASRAIDHAGEPRLGFGGDDLLTRPARSTLPGVVAYSPALLFTSGRFADRFVADATVAALTLAAGGDTRGLQAHRGWEAIGIVGGARVRYEGGEEPRALLLSRVAEHPAAAALVVESLAARGPGGLDPLLRPDVPHSPAHGVATDLPSHWLDRLDDLGTVDDPDHPAISALATPALADPYPITGFLGAVAAEPAAARAVLLAVAEAAATGAPAVGDPGTAAGLDLVLATNVATMIPPETRRRVGVEDPPVEAVTDPPVGPAAWRSSWRTVHGEVLRWGRGQALAAATDLLLAEALVASVDAGGRVDFEAMAPFAHLAGRAEAEAYRAAADYAASLDEEARSRNTAANRSAAVATGAAGFLPGVGLLAAATGLGWTWFFDGYPTDQLLAQRTQAWENEYERTDRFRWKKLAAGSYIETQLGPGRQGRIELAVPGLGRRTVSVRATVDPGRYQWQHPETRRWTDLAPIDDDGGRDLLPHDEPPPIRWVVSAADEVLEEFRDGVDVAARPTAGHARSRGGLDDGLRDARWTSEWLGRS